MMGIPCKSGIMLWGGGSQARMIESMIGDLNLGSVQTIFDPIIEQSVFTTDTRFVQSFKTAAERCACLSDFVVCIGNYAGFARTQTSMLLQEIGLNPLSIIHETAWMDDTVLSGVGLQIMPRATVQKFVSIGNWSIINTGSVIDHECVIGMGVHVMGGAAIAGRVIIENYATIGTNATILPDICIGEGAIVGAGAVVTRDVSPGQVVTGIPAKFVRNNPQQSAVEMLHEFRECWVAAQNDGSGPFRNNRGIL